MTTLNNVTDAFDDWLEDLDGTRNPGGYVNGRWVANTSVILNITGVVQNATPDDLKVLPEGNRNEEAIKIHTTFKLIPQIDNDTEGDYIHYGEYMWLVYNVAHRYIGGYHKAILIKARKYQPPPSP